MAKYMPALTLVICMASASALHAQDTTKPLGKWQRKVGKTNVMLNVENNRLHIICTGDKVVTLHADYATTHDGLIYGVVTSIECDENEETDMTKTLFDAPFSFRYRIDEGALIIHDMKAHDADSKDDMWNGRYKAIHPTAIRAETIPTLYYNVPLYLNPNVPQTYVRPPCPIAPSFSSSKILENHPQKAPEETETIFNFWTGFIR